MSDYNQQVKRILLGDIDFFDRHYKISRNHIPDEMRLSIREFGVLEPPAVIDQDGTYRVVFGFNRIDVLKETGADSVEAVVLSTLDTEWYIGRVLIKCLRNEIGPVGRIRTHAILRELDIEAGRLDRIAKKCLRVPDDFLRDETLAVRMGELPGSLADYLDWRDIQFRVIRDLVRLPRAVHEALTAWIDYAPLRVNIFRFIIDMLSDILVRDGEVGFVTGIRPDESVDRKQWEEHLYGIIRAVRYPEYSRLKKQADAIAGYFEARGISLEYPRYFEGDRLSLTMSLGRGDDPASAREKIHDADLSRLKELLDLL